MKIKVAQLTELTLKALKSHGYTDEESNILSGMLLYAQLRGNNQGVVKLINKNFAKSPDAKEIIIEKETKLSGRINGQQNAGAVVMNKAVQMAISKAKEHGFGMVGTNNTKTSTGALGYWATMIAKEGLIGFVFAGSPETVTYHGSYEPIFGTNPLAIGIPCEGDPLVLDMATAAMAYYGLIEAKTAGRKIPPDIAYDKDGNLTDDPALAMDGALRPFDKSYKGAALSMMVEVLTGPLVGASFTGIGDTANNWGNMVIALDPSLLVDPVEFKKNISALTQKVKQIKKLPGVTEIVLPSERGNKLTKERLISGEIEVEDNLYNELKKVSEK